ncbi:MAG: hypothetical protein AABW81_00725 [Nanoarchaeota archaeon]
MKNKIFIGLWALIMVSIFGYITFGSFENTATGNVVITKPKLPVSSSKCIDSDGGLNYNLVGSTYLINFNNPKKVDRCTYCTSTVSSTVCKSVVEYYCVGTQIVSKTYNCPKGCSKGACVK